MTKIFLSWITEGENIPRRYQSDWVALANDILWRSARSGHSEKTAQSRVLLKKFRRYVETALELKVGALRDLDSSHSVGSLDQSSQQGRVIGRFVGLQPHSVIVPPRLSEVMTISVSPFPASADKDQVNYLWQSNSSSCDSARESSSPNPYV